MVISCTIIVNMYSLLYVDMQDYDTAGQGEAISVASTLVWTSGKIGDFRGSVRIPIAKLSGNQRDSSGSYQTLPFAKTPNSYSQRRLSYTWIGNFNSCALVDISMRVLLLGASGFIGQSIVLKKPQDVELTGTYFKNEIAKVCVTYIFTNYYH